MSELCVRYSGLVTVLLGLAERLSAAALLVVADAAALGDKTEHAVDAIFAGGAHLLLLSVAGLPKEKALEVLEQARLRGQRSQGIIVVGSDIALATRFSADALLLGEGAPSSTKARKGLSRWALVGRECDTKTELELLARDADTAFATVGPAATHSGIGTEIISHATRLLPPTDPTAKPWFAAGGVTLQNLDEVIEAGATRVAVGSAITGATDIERATRAFTTVLQERWGKPDLANYFNGPVLP